VQSGGNEWLYRQIIEKTQDAIIFADREGVIQLWNSGAEAMFGYEAAEACGKSLDLIIPESLRPRHWDGYRQAVKAGKSRYGNELLAVPAMRSDGKRISIEFTIVMLHHGTNQVKGCAAIIRDVTARWQREKAIKERLAALETK
jgi:PAS domain S-box-containing protein